MHDKNLLPLSAAEAGLIRADYLFGATIEDLEHRYHRSGTKLAAVVRNELFADPTYSPPQVRPGPRSRILEEPPRHIGAVPDWPKPPREVQRCPHCHLCMLHVEAILGGDEQTILGLWQFHCAACGREFGAHELPGLAVAS